MLRHLLVLTTICPTLLTAQAATMDATGGEPRIVASATRTSRLTADRGVMLVTVEANGETASDASQRASTKLQAVSAALRSAGVPADALTTIPFAVTPSGGRDQFGQPAAPQMVARHVIRVPVSRLEQVMTLSAAALGAGASQAFPQLTEAAGVDSARRARNADALQAARSDAEALATSLGGRLGALIEVSTSSSGPFTGNQNFPLFSNPYANYSASVALPEIPITVNVTVRYRFIAR
ncbi:MAG: SIMPL domain-containing protein [Gemmatimonadota bacterium]